MKLSEFIGAHMDEILAEWDAYALTMRPAADDMSLRALRDHAEQMLRDIAVDIESEQTAQEQEEKSQGSDDDAAGASAASTHGALRHANQFSLLQLSSEFRALRASVLRLWLPHVPQTSVQTLQAVVRFNEAIDQALAESIVTYSARAEAARDLFLAVLGHDLRAPLATIGLAGDVLLQRKAADGNVAEIGTRIKRAARQMTSLVEDLIGYTRSKLGAGMPIALKTVDVGQICVEAVADASAMHPACHYQLQSSGRLDGSFDGVRLHQLLVNLLGNACQHGAAGQPVRIEASAQSDGVRIRVSNKGEVIPAESLEHIFQPLVQLHSDDPADARSGTSLGLGLYIAREIATGHGGNLSVTSSETDGTCFTLTLPREGNSGRP